MASLEHKLIKAIKSKDQATLTKVFKEIYDTYYKLVIYIANQYLKSKEDVEEVCDDVFLNFFNHLENFSYDGNIKYYLTTSAKNSALSKVRFNNIRDAEEMSDEVGEEDIYETDLVKVMKKYLTSEEIEIINLHAIYDYTFLEIGQKLDKPLNSVKSMYRRAIEKVQKGVKVDEEI